MKKNREMNLIPANGWAIAGALAVLLGACAGTHSTKSTRNPATDGTFSQLKANYDKLYPLYAIECASSKYDHKAQKPGGPYGHTFMYLKGACQDKSADYPKIKVCDAGTDLGNPESGVGLALDKNFSNTRFVATDGFNLLINGDLSDNAPLDTPAFEAAVSKFVSDGGARGVIMTQNSLDRKAARDKATGNVIPDEEWVAREVIGSSFAVDFARNLGCVTVPINQTMLESAVKEVNDQNVPFVTKKKKFRWNAVSDQCVQFTHNVFAAMGIGHHIVTSANKFRIVWDVATQLIPFVTTQMPAPENDAINLDEETNNGKIFTLDQAYSKPSIRDSFNAFKRLPATDGVLFWTQAAHADQNAYFNTEARLKAFDIPIITPIERKYRRLTEMPSSTEILSNLTAYQSKLQATIDDMAIANNTPDSYCTFVAGQKKELNDIDYMAFCKDYVSYLLNTRKDVEARLSALTASN